MLGNQKWAEKEAKEYPEPAIRIDDQILIEKLKASMEGDIVNDFNKIASQ